MSKKLNGIYGTLNAKKLYDAVVETCVKNGCTIKSFFKDTYKDHDEKWFQHVKKKKLWRDARYSKALQSC